MTEPGLQENYTVGKWAGRPNYECRLCPFKTLHFEQRHRTESLGIVDHLNRVHGVGAYGPRPDSVVTPSGGPPEVPGDGQARQPDPEAVRRPWEPSESQDPQEEQTSGGPTARQPSRSSRTTRPSAPAVTTEEDSES